MQNESSAPRDGAGAPIFPTDEPRITAMDQITWQTRMSCLNLVLGAQPQMMPDRGLSLG